jgi:hypothetical protein
MRVTFRASPVKEADETAYWLELMVAESVGVPVALAAALDEASQLVAIFTTIKRRAEGKEGRMDNEE